MPCSAPEVSWSRVGGLLRPEQRADSLCVGWLLGRVGGRMPEGQTRGRDVQQGRASDTSTVAGSPMVMMLGRHLIGPGGGEGGGEGRRRADEKAFLEGSRWGRGGFVTCKSGAFWTSHVVFGVDWAGGQKGFRACQNSAMPG